jgi:8-oxo-dGTP diphosphatase
MIKCTFENGNLASLRHVTMHAMVIKDGKILLVKRATHLTNGGKFGFPGGFLDRDETTAQGALRELKEETGYEGKIISLFSICDDPKRRGEDRQNIVFDYLIEVGEKTSEPDKESSEQTWFSLDALPPEEEFAFDHFKHIQIYKKYLENPAATSLPLVY